MCAQEKDFELLEETQIECLKERYNQHQEQRYFEVLQDEKIFSGCKGKYVDTLCIGRHSHKYLCKECPSAATKASPVVEKTWFVNELEYSGSVCPPESPVLGEDESRKTPLDSSEGSPQGDIPVNTMIYVHGHTAMDVC